MVGVDSLYQQSRHRMIHTTDINDFEAVFGLAQALPADERAVFEAHTGEAFDPEQFMVGLAEATGGYGSHFTFWDGEKAIAAGGFIPQRPGVVRTWFVAPEETWQTHGKELTEWCAKLIQQQLDEKLAHRVETVTLVDRIKARAWYERIGLNYESTLRGFGAN